MKALPDVALRQLAKGIPADKVLLPEIDLTPKQRQFVRAMAEGASKREAYVQAHDVNAGSRSAGVTACHIAAQPKIQSALEQQKAVERLRYSQNPDQIRTFVVDQLQHEAKTAQKPNDRLRALELLGKLADVAAFETRSVVTHQRSDVRSQLRSKLERLAAIEVEARETPTLGGEGQSDGFVGGATTSINPHQQSAIHQQSQVSYQYDSEGVGVENESVGLGEEVIEEVAPHEKDLGSHTGGGKKDRPIWEDPKRWYKEHIGEIEMEEVLPRDEAREMIQKKLRDEK
jgi:hypothetical protein